MQNRKNMCKCVLPMIMVLMAMGCRQPGLSQQQSLFGNNNPTSAGTFAGNPSSGFQNPPTAGQSAALQSRLNQFDSDNQNLHAQVAALQQRLQNANSYNDQLRQQLSDQLAQLQRAHSQSQQTAATQQTGYPPSAWQNREVQGHLSTGQGAVPANFAGATLRANNGLMQKLQTVQLPGFKAWMDGDVIRIEGPTDRLFVSGTYQINSNDAITIANLANTIRQNFPRQVVGVEAHWDGTPIQPATTSHHQLTATQALAVFDLLVKSGLPHDQVFTMAVGSNRPRYPQGPANRRIEIVIYPETF